MLSYLAAIHEQLVMHGRDAKKVARAVPPALRRRCLDEAEWVAGWVSLLCSELDDLLKRPPAGPAWDMPAVRARIGL